MVNKVYCFYDDVSCSFLPTFFQMPNDEVAKRSFSNFANSPQFPFKDIKCDLKIYQVGEFNLEQGLVSCEKRFMCNLVDLIKE